MGAITRLGRPLVAALATALAGCGVPTPSQGLYENVSVPRTADLGAAPDVSQDEWSVARARLDQMKRALPTRPYVERVRIGIVDPRTGKRYEARGAVAVSPDRAARMLLVGPGGATALDMWVTKDRFRFAVPALQLEQRGGTDPADAKGLPVGLLRWWFLSPLGGRLLLARSTKTESTWLLRDGDATITMRSDGRRLVAIRREAGRLEGIEWIGRGIAPQTGARGRYVEGRFGTSVEIAIEEVLPSEPDPAAFLDPDEEGMAL